MSDTQEEIQNQEGRASTAEVVEQEQAEKVVQGQPESTSGQVEPSALPSSTAPPPTPFEVLQLARTELNASLGFIHGSSETISAADKEVKQLEAELASAQGNASRARTAALSYRQGLHAACDKTVAAIDRLRVKYPL